MERIPFFVGNNVGYWDEVGEGLHLGLRKAPCIVVLKSAWLSGVASASERRIGGSEADDLSLKSQGDRTCTGAVQAAVREGVC
jgi:hypothetical protein